MKVLILGGNRFFGRRLTQGLLDRGIEVTLLNRGQRPDEFGSHVRRIRLDRKELRESHPLLNNQSWDIVYDQICYDGMEAQGACKAFRDKTMKYVFTSSQSVYGHGKSISESTFDPRAYKFEKPITRDIDYGEAKRQAEAMFFREAGFPICAVRFPIVLGEDDHDQRLHFHVRRLLEGQPIYFPNPGARISFIRSLDAARFLVSLTDHFIEGPINCCAPKPISLRDFILSLEQTTGKKAVLANSSESGDISPFGIKADWFMDVSKMEREGFRIDSIQAWLPSLVSTIMKDLFTAD